MIVKVKRPFSVTACFRPAHIASCGESVALNLQSKIYCRLHNYNNNNKGKGRMEDIRRDYYYYYQFYHKGRHTQKAKPVQGVSLTKKHNTLHKKNKQNTKTRDTTDVN